MDAVVQERRKRKIKCRPDKWHNGMKGGNSENYDNNDKNDDNDKDNKDENDDRDNGKAGWMMARVYPDI